MGKESNALGYPFVSQRHSAAVYEDKSSILHRVPLRTAIVEPIRRVRAPIKTRSVYDVYPAPAHYDPAPPARVNPYHAVYGTRKTCVQETDDASHYMHERTKWMLRKEYERYHETWKPYYYGTKSEQEQYKSYLRQGLKQQMSDKAKRLKEADAAKSLEAKQVEELCRAFDEKTSATQHARKEFLLKFRDANKQLIAEREQFRKLERRNTISLEQLQLRFNPINWSCTLK
ncbi:hypothetical protein FBUS_08028 [Fasciolopsis buskii]|uniref:Uncharacterized protein n=1 Tax=Fasciolopsis buskii TaxID=27845 RepID=A0A8E0RTG2_9TREM|nr:hypothetical protein FBUS_08028 [Fasciolopsis buski]